MNKALTLIIACACSLALGGCLPEEFIVWSHDGAHAAVMASDGLYLSDAAGKLSPVTTGTPPTAIKAFDAAWLSDSKHLVLVTQRPVDTWAAAATLLAPDRRKEIIADAAKVRAELLAHPGGLENFQPKSIQGARLADLGLMLMYLRDQGDKQLQEKLGAKWEDIRKLQANVYGLAICDPLVSPARLEIITESLTEMRSPRVSPRGTAIGFVTGDPKGEQLGSWLMVVPAKPGAKPVEAAQQVSQYFDWTPDGQAVVFGRATLPQSDTDKPPLRLGAVTRREVCDPAGSILPKLPDPQDLAGLLFDDFMRVRCLKDGRILFAAADIHLPCTSAGMPQKPTLFFIDPAKQAMVTRVWGQAADAKIPDHVDRFQLSPDEKRVAILGPKDEVAVITLADGTIDTIQPAQPNGKSLLLPAWRSDDELSFLSLITTPKGSAPTEEVVLWSLPNRSARMISKDWPAEVIKGFLAADKGTDTTQPATQPVARPATRP